MIITAPFNSVTDVQAYSVASLGCGDWRWGDGGVGGGRHGAPDMHMPYQLNETKTKTS